MRIKFHARQQRSTDTLIIMIISNLKKQMFNCFFLSSLQPSSLPRSSPENYVILPNRSNPHPSPPSPRGANSWLALYFFSESLNISLFASFSVIAFLVQKNFHVRNVTSSIQSYYRDVFPRNIFQWTCLFDRRYLGVISLPTLLLAFLPIARIPGQRQTTRKFQGLSQREGGRTSKLVMADWKDWW